jgi:hypothetical protein
VRRRSSLRFRPEVSRLGPSTTTVDAPVAFVGSLTAETSTGQKSYTGVGFQPKLVIFFGTEQTADGVAAELSAFFGAAASATGRHSTAIAHDDEVATVNCGTHHSDAHCITILSNGTPTVQTTADFVSMDADGFTLDWDAVSGSAHIVRFLALGGDALTNVKVDKFATATSAGAQGVTGVGFQPDGLLLIQAGMTSATVLPGTRVGTYPSIGGANSSSSMGCSSIRADDGGADASFGTYQQGDELNSARGITNTCTLTSFDSDGFTVNWSAVSVTARHAFYVAIKGMSVKVGVETQKGATGTKATTGVGFKPKALLVLGSNKIASDVDVTGQMTLTIGASDGTREGCVWVGADKPSNSQADNATDSAKVLQHRSLSGTLVAEADVSSFDSDGFTLDWTTADTTGRQFVYIAFG